MEKLFIKPLIVRCNIKILLFDIENSPIVTWAWDIHGEPMHSTTFVKEDWYVMCWSAKWLGEKKVYSYALPDFKYDHRNPCDKKILEKLWDILDEADVVIAHNGFAFDRRKANARFIQHGMPPPSPYKMIDTLKVARSTFMFTSNKLGDLGHYLGVGSKVETGGFDLWKDCMNGCSKAWKKMVRYCKNDVVLLEKIYLKLRPYIKNHPNQNVYNQTIENCPKCGSDNIIKRGLSYNLTGPKQRYQCKDCGGWATEGKVVKNG